MSASLENSTVAMGLEKINFHSSPKEGQCERIYKLSYNCTHFTCCICSPCLFNLFVEHITWMYESQAGLKINGRNINNLRYADDTTLMAESKEELKSPLMRRKGERKSCLKSQHSKTKIMASGPITSWQTDGGKSGNSGTFYFSGLQNHCGQWLQPWN